MLTFLAELSAYFNPLNIFRYITFRTGGATATAMLFVFWLGPSIISLLRLKQGKGQPLPEDGPEPPPIPHARPRGRPEVAPSGHARHAGHGRAHDHGGRAGQHAAVGQPHQPLRLGGA